MCCDNVIPVCVKPPTNSSGSAPSGSAARNRKTAVMRFRPEAGLREDELVKVAVQSCMHARERAACAGRWLARCS